MSQRFRPRLTQLHDADSGQVFYETTCAEQSSSNPVTTWLSAQRGRKVTSREHYQNDVVPSLEELSLRAIVANADSIRISTLQDVPWQFAKKIWDRLGLLGQRNTKLWQVYATLYANEKESSKALSERRPPQLQPELMVQSLPYLSSPSSAWLTILSLHDVDLVRADWMKLAEMPNLALLCTQGLSNQPVEEAVLKGWGRRALEASAFPRLRLLMLNAATLSGHSLDSLAHLPVLSACHVTCQKIDKDLNELLITGQAVGWTSHKKSPLISRLRARPSETEASRGEPIGRSDLSRYLQAVLEHDDLSTDSNRPLLNVRCGSDRGPPGLRTFSASLWLARDRVAQQQQHEQRKRPLPIMSAADSGSQGAPKIRKTARKDLSDVLSLFSG